LTQSNEIPGPRASRFDLHVHTAERSTCAAVPAEEVLRIAQKQGLDGLAFTDHHAVWPREELERVRERAGVELVLLSGQEVTFLGIDFLVFGWDGDPGVFTDREDFVEGVHRDGGVAIVAHPYSILYYLDAEIMAGWGVDGVEVLNSLKGGPTPAERHALASMGLAEVGGSDFHRALFQDRLGTCWTEIEGEVRDLESLMAAIREGRTRAAGY